jgi:hypothetical protein
MKESVTKAYQLAKLLAECYNIASTCARTVSQHNGFTSDKSPDHPVPTAEFHLHFPHTFTGQYLGMGQNLVSKHGN